MRLARWIVVNVLFGLLPFLAAFAVRSYYGGHAPALRDVFGSGDATLIVMGWSIATVVEEFDARPVTSLRVGLGLSSLLLLLVGAVAYGCLTADSVTGRVQTPRQMQMVTTLSIVGLAISAVVSTLAVAVRPREESTG